MLPTDEQIVSPPPISGGSVRQIDDVDRALIKALRADGRISLTDLADRVNVSRSTVHARVQRLRDDGVITGFTATVDPTVLGLGVSAWVFLDVEQHDWRSLRDELAALPGVDYLAMCAGRFDLMMLVRAESIASLRDVLLERVQRMVDVKSTETVLILDETGRP
jgi:DNA-binding Lrp family transcriptional regulator